VGGTEGLNALNSEIETDDARMGPPLLTKSEIRLGYCLLGRRSLASGRIP
jgi:hypothetical protein